MLTALLVLQLFAPDWEAIYAKLEPSLVPVGFYRQFDEFVPICTGVVVAPLRVVTEEHCLKELPQVFVSGLPARIIKEQNQAVLLGLDPPQPSSWRPIRVASARPRIGSPVMAIGYGFGTPQLIITIGHTATKASLPGFPEHESDDVWFDLNAIGGMSGGPIVNAQGEVVSLTRGVMADGVPSPNSLTYGASTSSLIRLTKF